MSGRVRVRRLSGEEGRQLQRIVRRGGGGKEKSIVRWRRAMVVLASAGGNTVSVIADLVQRVLVGELVLPSVAFQYLLSADRVYGAAFIQDKIQASRRRSSTNSHTNSS